MDLLPQDTRRFLRLACVHCLYGRSAEGIIISSNLCERLEVRLPRQGHSANRLPCVVWARHAGQGGEPATAGPLYKASAMRSAAQTTLGAPGAARGRLGRRGIRLMFVEVD
jgi:hypothetical protein